MIEELIQEEILDETDIYVDIHKRIQVARVQRARRANNYVRIQLENFVCFKIKTFAHMTK